MSNENDDIPARIVLVSRYISEKNWSGAIRELQVGLRLNPENPTYHKLLGISYHSLKRFDEAAKEFQVVLQLKPEGEDDVHNLLATTYFYQGHLDKAIDEYKIGLNANPSDSNARFLLARSYHKQGYLQEALNEYRTLLQNNPSQAEQIHFSMGVLYSEQGELDKAIQEFQESLKINPNDGESHFRLGKCYEQQGRKDLAAHEFQAAAKLGFGLAVKKTKSPWLGVFLNWIFGIGYIYAGNWLRFLVVLILRFGVSAGMELVGFSQYSGAAVGVVVLLSMFDVYNLITKYNEQLVKS